MKSWQIFVAGAAAVIASLLLPLYEPVIAGLAALAVVVVVGLGFFLHPRRDIFYVRTTVRRFDLDGNLCLEHDQLAVRVELARLWLLFLPTSLAVSFLVVTTANGTLWRFSLLARMFAGTIISLADYSSLSPSTCCCRSLGLDYRAMGAERRRRL